MRKIVTFLFLYHLSFLLTSLGIVYLEEGYGSEIFAGIWWFNIYYNTIAFLFHGIFLYISFRFKAVRFISALVRFIGILLILNIFPYYFNRVFLTVELINKSSAEEWKMALLIHSCCLFSFGVAELAKNRKSVTEKVRI